MAMTWGHDETGVVIVPGEGKAKKKPKPPRPAKPERVARTQVAPVRPAAPPVGLPIARPGLARAPSVWPAATATRPAQAAPRRLLARLARALGLVILVAAIAAGGFAVGALTELGTYAESRLLGAPPAPSPTAAAADPRIPALEAELARLREELAATRLRATAATPTAPAPAATTTTTTTGSEGSAAKRPHHRHRGR